MFRQKSIVLTDRHKSSKKVNRICQYQPPFDLIKNLTGKKYTLVMILWNINKSRLNVSFRIYKIEIYNVNDRIYKKKNTF